jgi:predicted permease
MNWLDRLKRMLRRGRLPAEYEREAEFHISERTDDLMAQGMSHREAVLEARRRFGRPSFDGNRSHSSNVRTWLESLFSDIRYAARSLRRSPVFTIVAILSLGLGIGANTAIFSLYNGLVLRALPVQNPGELVQVTFGNGRVHFTNPLWEEFRDQQDVLGAVFTFGDPTFNLADGGQVRNVRGHWVSGDFFRTLGVVPILGRVLASSDDYRGCPAVAAVSYRFWQRELGGAAEAVGSTLMLSGHPFEVVGVAHPAFTGVEVGRATEVYVPICAHPIVYPERNTLDHASNWFIRVIGRLNAGMTMEEASARLEALSSRVFGATVPPLWDSDGQARYREFKFSLRSAANGVSSWRGLYQSALLVLLGVVGVVLLIACGNVANLLLARATKRHHEVSVRKAIGSGRGRLVQLLVAESLLLAFVSACVAVVFAHWASSFLVSMLANGGNLWLDIGLDMRVLCFTMAVASGTGILFGLAPAWRASSATPQSALRTACREIHERKGRFSVGKALVVGQLALSLFLVVGAGLLIGTLATLQSTDMGFNRNGVLLVSVNKRNAGYSDEESRLADRELIERIRALPGVVSASCAKISPIGGTTWNDYAEVDGYEPADRRDALVWFNSASDGFFSTLETPLLAGRDFDSRDALGSVQVAIVNETMARRFFGNPQPLGRHFRITRHGEDVQVYEVIGVVADTKYRNVDEETRPIANFPLAQDADDWQHVDVQIRAAGEPADLISAVTSTIANVHPRLSIRFSTLDDNVTASLARPRILAVLSGFFGGVALLLAMIGLYGTLSYRVASRRNEIGLRLALGAGQVRVLRMVLGEVGRMTSLGIVLGVGCAIAGTRLLASFLFGVEATDPSTLALSAAILATVALAAGTLPAWHAARLDPMETLREE